jgi:hypothetical protein
MSKAKENLRAAPAKGVCERLGYRRTPWALLNRIDKKAKFTGMSIFAVLAFQDPASVGDALRKAFEPEDVFTPDAPGWWLVAKTGGTATEVATQIGALNPKNGTAISGTLVVPVSSADGGLTNSALDWIRKHPRSG